MAFYEAHERREMKSHGIAICKVVEKEEKRQSKSNDDDDEGKEI